MSKKILVLEDEEELGRSIKKFLEQHNYQVTYLSDITRVESIYVENPDLIITDLLMPSFHGFDICREVKADSNLKDVPLIAMTAVYKDTFSRSEVRRIGVDEFLEKPFKFSKLLEKVEKLLGTGSGLGEVTEAPSTPEKIKETKEINDKPAKAKPDTFPEEEETKGPGVKAAVPPITPEEEKRRDKMILEQFQEMQQNYSSRLPEKVLELEEIWEHIQDMKSSQQLKKQLAEFRRKIHSLTGSGSTFGFEKISEYARKLELVVDMIIVEGENTINDRKYRVNELLDNMRHQPIISTELEIIRQEKMNKKKGIK